MKFHRFPTYWIALVLLVLVGCAPRVKVGERITPTLPENRLSILEERARDWDGYRAMLHISAESGRGTLRRVRTLVLAAPEGRFRLEAMSPFGQSVGLLLLNEERSSLWIPSEKVVFTAGRAETLLQRLLGIPIPMEAFALSIAAVVPREALVGLRSEALDSGWRVYSHDSSDPWTTTWEFGASPFSLKQMRVHGESLDITVRYEPFVDLDARKTPERMVFSASDWRMEVKVDQIQSVHEFQGGAFHVTLPGGLRTIDLDHEEWKGRSF
jgi:outer membrane biogenesis lipoprotein LolB